MANANTEQELILNLSKVSHLQRAKILRWLNENISNNLLNDQVNILEKSIRHLQGSFEENYHVAKKMISVILSS